MCRDPSSKHTSCATGQHGREGEAACCYRQVRWKTIVELTKTSSRCVDEDRSSRCVDEDRSSRCVDEDRTSRCVTEDRSSRCVDEDRSSRYVDEDRSSRCG